MATIRKRGNNWTCQIRRKGFQSIGKTFRTKEDAENFALEVEGGIEKERALFSLSPSAYRLPVTNLDLQVIYISSVKRAKKYCMEHTITESEFMEIFHQQDGKCAVSGLHFSGGKSDQWRVRPFYPSFDRIDSQKGYTKDNVRFVLTSVNGVSKS